MHQNPLNLSRRPEIPAPRQWVVWPADASLEPRLTPRSKPSAPKLFTSRWELAKAEQRFLTLANSTLGLEVSCCERN